MESFRKEFQRFTGTILNQPHECDPMLYSALTEILLTNGFISNKYPKTATASANATPINQILLFENQLNITGDANGEMWPELANM